ncbi:hypothetical protein JKL49_02730 [Phenylobacterium sp. 20VBR1]|uniref:Uncharacterized protein n=1 Tax=Phenylobacterium glaciei TaxID=2803784 RepID=A0A941CYM4_9CAUL|nr:hypothetical protein [Phenylobacterium glaciei]MBR7618292.1 hypothetical protein [Phenylobacterium glaciei]QQZ50757.1 hypothetical protein JKL49_05140 [Phenylobacterium glaciei]
MNTTLGAERSAGPWFTASMFRARYEGRAVGFTEYLVTAMRAYADKALS